MPQPETTTRLVVGRMSRLLMPQQIVGRMSKLLMLLLFDGVAEFEHLILLPHLESS